MEEIVKKLTILNKTIATMESCTGGYVVNEITNISGASEVLKYSAVTYSNEFKIKMGVNAQTINEYSVYSIEVAREMSKKISDFTSSDYGIGITGHLLTIDKNNSNAELNKVYVSIYEKEKDTYFTKVLELTNKERIKNKQYISEEIQKMLKQILNLI